MKICEEKAIEIIKEECDDWTLVYDESINCYDGILTMEAVFKHKEKHYIVKYEYPANTKFECPPFDGGDVEFKEAMEVSVVTKKWVPVPTEENDVKNT